MSDYEQKQAEEAEYLEGRIEEARAAVQRENVNSAAISKELEDARNARSPKAPRRPGEGGPEFVPSLNRLEDVEHWRKRIEAERERGEPIPVE